MKSDGGILWFLLNKARSGAPGRRALSFGFDGVNDYISGNDTIGRTGYDLNVSGNVSTGSDGDGDYFLINGNRDHTAGTGTKAEMSASASTGLTQATSFTMKVKCKWSAFPANNSSGLFASYQDAGFQLNTSQVVFGLRGSSTVQLTYAASINTLYDLHLVYNASEQKFYNYINGVLQNVGGTAGPTTFSISDFYIGDNGITGGNVTSCNKYIYHACTWNRALTQAEIDADIALGNTAKSDPTIVAYYIPENLQYNTQYLTNPTALDQSNRVKTGTTSVTADTTVAPDGTTTADTVTIAGTATQGCNTVVTAIAGSSIASKTFIVKAFVKVSAGTDQFRLQCSHNGVADYYSSNLTATTDRQEFTFTQAFTSSTSGTGITAGLVNDSGAGGATLEVRNVRLYLSNQVLRDESPNIGGYIGRKTPVVMSAWIKLGADSLANNTKQSAFQVPRRYLQFRDTTNVLQFRSDTTLAARTAAVSGSAILGNGNRNKVHVLGVSYWDGTGWLHKAYIDGVQTSGSPVTYTNTVRPASTIYRTNASLGFYATDYFSGNIRDARVYTFTGSFTDADALAIKNGGEPTSAGVTKYLQYKPQLGEIGTTTQDVSTNNRDATLNGGVTRVFI